MNKDEKFYSLLSKLQTLNLRQETYPLLEEESLPDELYQELKDAEIVASKIDVDKHRWYETSVTVYKIYGRFLGVRSISNLYSESSDYEDICWTHWFAEMEAVQSVSYVVKK